ncbi:hypothetical protein FO488_07730 [Geobacter sp. FeAm09]|uniref:hypothetical protein n=1 Tax=Geobacter sp. FeAm09 TaxID=2597769 RepID=UPI0011ED7039|nr:hypothetical protein [Geobacter sp. FeAm09]QEM68060.1 hypothetical protein FO488_07730 [Geobacter sp. FeAm09]
MRLLETYAIHRKCLLPFVMAAALFFILQGISVPHLADPREPRLSSPQKNKPATSAVLKTLLQSPHGKIAKHPPFLDRSGTASRLCLPTAHIASVPHDLHVPVSAAVPAVPARAPPA